VSVQVSTSARLSNVLDGTPQVRLSPNAMKRVAATALGGVGMIDAGSDGVSCAAVPTVSPLVVGVGEVGDSAHETESKAAATALTSRASGRVIFCILPSIPQMPPPDRPPARVSLPA
jgi:hypothetical protein